MTLVAADVSHRSLLHQQSSLLTEGCFGMGQQLAWTASAKLMA